LRSDLSDDDRKAICEAFKAGLSRRTLANQFGVSKTTISCLVDPQFAEKHRKRFLVWYQKNAVRDRRNSAAWNRSNHQRAQHNLTLWRQNHPDQARAHVQRRRAKLCCAPGLGWTAEEIQTLNAVIYQNTCIYCLKEVAPGSLEIDHVVPLSRGGTNFPDNLVLSCRSCNSSKHARLLSVWKNGEHVSVIAFAQEVARLWPVIRSVCTSDFTAITA